jgi:maltose alpha-D-glucosyltransferase/alpha-amylase
MAFHFPVMPRMFMAIRMEDRYPIVDILDQTPPIPETSQWALFLRNHDELTLEMVTDEERDYMYRAYASDPQARINLGIRRRLAPLLGNNRRRIELMNGLLFALPGTPVLYYGDEIGMGDNVFLGDRNGVRTPMQWSGDRNAGFSSANRQQLYLPVIVDPEYHYEAINVEAQQANPHSLLWWMKRLIALRKRHRAFGRGSIEFLHPDNRHILAFVRRDADETLLVVANLSRFAQYGELDLSAFEGSRPVELFGQVDFPTIARTPYLLSLGPHSFMWFTLQPPAVELRPFPSDPVELPRLAPVDELLDLATGPRAAGLAELLASWARHRRWFRGKARRIASSQIRDAIPMTAGEAAAIFVILGVQFTEGDPEEYLVPLAALPEAAAAPMLAETPWAGIARLESDGDGTGSRIVVDAMRIAAFSDVLLATVAGRRRLRGVRGEIAGQPTRAFRVLRGDGSENLNVAPSRAEQSNSSVIFGDRLILKLYRRLDAGVNPDLEVSAFLTERGFAHVPTVAGSLEYRAPGGGGAAASIVQAFVPNEGDVWEVTLDDLGDYLERAIIAGAPPDPGAASAAALLERADGDAPRAAQEAIGSYLGTARLLGTRTGELHLALASDADDPAFAPEPFSALYQRSLHQSVRTTIGQNLRFLARWVDSVPEPARADARAALAMEAIADERLSGLLDRRIGGARIRCHGDLHLGQILFTGRDIAFIDFEGEPGRPLSERRLKRSALTDVAGMIRSFHYAASGALLRLTDAGAIRPADAVRLDGWARHWYVWVAAAFLAGYRTAVAGAEFLPGDRDEWAILLDALLLQKAFYELSYELNNRPEWVSIPLQGIVSLLRD